MRRLVSVFALAAGCGGSDPALPGPVQLFAAASTAEVVEQIARTFDAPVSTSFGSSSGLARQIEDRAPADVFLSAHRVWVERLAQSGLLAGTPRVLCRNRLVAVVAERSDWLTAPPRNLVELSERLSDGERVAIADAGVPAGEYARQSLAGTGVLEALAPHLVGQTDVRDVLRAVASGQAVAGFVYATDARVGRVVELFELDPATHEPIEYFAALVAGPHAEHATRFLEHLTSPAAREVLRAAGFVVEED